MPLDNATFAFCAAIKGYKQLRGLDYNRADRYPENVECRQTVWWVVQQVAECSTNTIAKVDGHYDRSTIQHGIYKISDAIRYKHLPPLRVMAETALRLKDIVIDQL